MPAFPIDQAQHAGSSEASQARLVLLTQLKEARTRRLAHVTACLADPVFHATATPDDVAMLRHHKAALEKVIALIEHQRTNTLATQEGAQPSSARSVSRPRWYLIWRWGR
ncbi:MAG TPA: hypothetical protein VKE41_18360 [Roseiflexaceae bacterium]|nr:hypothetical protein [Roseiflexaceae bacterium]